jgi:TonB family protein
MKHLLPLMIFALALSSAFAQAEAPVPSTGHKAKALAIYTPRPPYPRDEKGRRPTGQGVVVMDVDPKTGWVTAARMEKSTGSKILDDAALWTFRQWRFRPGTVRQVHSPITFTHRPVR